MDEVYMRQLIAIGAVYFAATPPPRLEQGLKAGAYTRPLLSST